MSKYYENTEQKVVDNEFEGSSRMVNTQDIDMSDSFIGQHHFGGERKEEEYGKDEEGILEDKKEQEQQNDLKKFMEVLKASYKVYEEKYQSIVLGGYEASRPKLEIFEPSFENSIFQDLKQMRKKRFSIPEHMKRTNQEFEIEQISNNSGKQSIYKQNGKLRRLNPKQIIQNFFRFVDLFNQNPHGNYFDLDQAQKIKSVFMVAGESDDNCISNILTLNCNVTVVRQFMGAEKNWWVSHSPDSYRLQYYVIQNNKSHEQDFTFNMNFWLLKFENFLRVVVLTFPFNSVYMNASKGIYWHQDFRLKTQKEKKQKRQKANPNTFDLNKDFEQTLTFLYERLIPEDFPREQIDINLNDYVFQNVDIVLIPSVPGKYYEDERKKYGLDKIQKVIKYFSDQKQLCFSNSVVTTQCYLQPKVNLSYVQYFASAFNNNIKITTDNFRGIYPRFLIHPRWGFRSVRVRSEQVTKDSDIIMYLTGQDIVPESWGIPSQDNSTIYGNSTLGILALRINYYHAMRLLPYQTEDVFKQPYDSLSEIVKFEEPDIRCLFI